MTSHSIESLENAVLIWARERGIFNSPNPEAQYKKLCEEVAELGLALGERSLPEIIDGIGDSLVVLIILSHIIGEDLSNCLWVAYKQIKYRKGKMVNGQFVKEE